MTQADGHAHASCCQAACIARQVLCALSYHCCCGMTMDVAHMHHDDQICPQARHGMRRKANVCAQHGFLGRQSLSFACEGPPMMPGAHAGVSARAPGQAPAARESGSMHTRQGPGGAQADAPYVPPWRQPVPGSVRSHVQHLRLFLYLPGRLACMVSTQVHTSCPSAIKDDTLHTPSSCQGTSAILKVKRKRANSTALALASLRLVLEESPVWGWITRMRVALPCQR